MAGRAEARCYMGVSYCVRLSLVPFRYACFSQFFLLILTGLRGESGGKRERERESEKERASARRKRIS